MRDQAHGMGRHRTPMPPLSDVFLFAEAVSAGASKRQLRHPKLIVPTRGVRIAADVAPEGSNPDLQAWLQHLRAVQLALPKEVAFSHVTSAAVLGLPLPHSTRPHQSEIHVASPEARNPLRRKGIVTHRWPGAVVTEYRAVRVASLRHTWLQCAQMLDVDALVVMADSIVGDDPARLTSLTEAVEAHDGRPGVRRLREALPLVRLGSRSPTETEARLLFLRAGFPEPRLNHHIDDGHGGWIACPDFSWEDEERGIRVAVEYDGAHHGTLAQRRRDAGRDRAYRTAGWTLVVITSEDLARPGPMLDELAHHLGVARRDVA